MDNDIKEILECLEKYGQLTPDAIDDLHYIRDYITNLREENEKLDNQNTLNRLYWEKLEQRIDKATEKINNLIEVKIKETDYDKFFGDNDYEIKKLKGIKNTLQGSDNNE